MLVVCKEIPKDEDRGQYFELGETLRHIEASENGGTHIVFGENFTEKEFNQYFERYLPIIQRRLNELGCVTDGKLCTRKEFKEYVNVHNDYRGHGTRNTIVFVGEPKKNCFRFFPKTNAVAQGEKLAYDCIKEMLEGNLDCIDKNIAQWFCTGIPMSFSFNPHPSILDYEFSKPEHYANKMKPFVF